MVENGVAVIVVKEGKVTNIECNDDSMKFMVRYEEDKGLLVQDMDVFEFPQTQPNHYEDLIYDEDEDCVEDCEDDSSKELSIEEVTLTEITPSTQLSNTSEEREYYVDRKTTIWERLYFNTSDTPAEIIERLKDCTTDFDNYYNIDNYEFLYDTHEIMLPEDNGGEATEELFVEGELLYSNEIIEESLNEVDNVTEKGE